MNKYATIADIQIGQILIANGQRYKRLSNTCHHLMGCVKVFEAPTGERMLFPKSKDEQRVLVRDNQTFEL